jgi:hypothetical protein
MDCVRHLDGLIAIQMLRDKKGVEKQKLHAKREAIQRVKKQSKMQQERDKAYERRLKGEVQNQYDQLGNGKVRESNGSWGTQSTRSMINGRNFSELASGRSFDGNPEEWEASNTTSHVYSDTFSQRSHLFKALKGKINNTLRRKKQSDNNLNSFTKRSSLSQPDLLFKTNSMVSTKSLDDLGDSDKKSFQIQARSERTGSFGSDSDDLNAALGHIVKKYDDEGNVSTEIRYDQSVSSKSNGSMASRTSRTSRTSQSSQKSSTSHDPDLASLESAGFEDHNHSTEMEVSSDMKAVVTFLSGLNLDQFSSPFLKESIDLNALVLCNDKDLQELGLPLGPRRKILEAGKRRKVALTSPGIMADSKI